jgi:beta-lactamase regulating signal transducer with metallopeptidase domain
MTTAIAWVNQTSAVVLASVLNTGWIALVAAATVGLVLRFTPRVNAATRHLAWWGVLAITVLGALIPRSATLSTIKATIAPRNSSPGASVRSHELRAAGSLAPTTRDLPVRAHAPQTSPAISAPSSAAHFAFLPSLPLTLPVGRWLEVVFAAWFAAFLLLFQRMTASYAHLRGLRKRASPAPDCAVAEFARCLRHAQASAQVRLLASSEIFSPLAAGFLHRVIVLPERMLAEISRSELQNILLHELAHFERRDNWTNLLARSLGCALLLHPVAAWALSRIEREREAACDEWVVTVSGSARQYAATLARLFEVYGARRGELLATGMAHRSSRLGERIEMILRPKRQFAAGVSFGRISLGAVAGLAMIAMGTQTPAWVALASDAAIAPASVTASRLITGAPPLATPPPAGARIPPSVTADSTLSADMLSGEMAKGPARTFQQVELRQSSHASSEGWTPEWTLERGRQTSSGQVRFSFGCHRNGSTWQEESDVPLSSLRDFSLSLLDHDGPVKFEYVRDAGELVCQGEARGGRASGAFTVNPNAQFVSALEKMGYPATDEEEVLSLMMSDVTLDFARDVKSTGLELRAGELASLRSHGVTAAYIREARQAGLTQLTADDFGELRTHGVEPQYVQRILAVDSKLTVDDVCELRTHGVEPEYLKGIKASGVAISIEDICSVRTHGVEPEYLKSIRAVSSNISIDDIDEYRTHGVEPEYLKGMLGVDSHLAVEDICQFRTHGVEPEYLQGVRSVSSHVSADEICELRTHGVEPTYLKGIQAADSKLTADQISELRTHGVEAGYYQSIKAVDPRLSIDDITQLRTHGVEPEYYKEVKLIDPKLSIDDITRLRTHGVEPGHLKEIRGAAPTLSIDEVTELSTHGVPGSFVTETSREGYHFSAEELSELWTHGIDADYLRSLQQMGLKNLTPKQILRLRGVS